MPKNEKTKTKNLMEEITYRIRISPIGNTFLKSIRRARTKGKTKGGNRVKIKDILKGISSFLSNWRSKVLLILGIVVTVVVGLHIYHYFNIQVTPWPGANQTELTKMNGEYNVLAIGLNSKEEYKYTEMLFLVSVDARTGDMRTYGVNPYYIVTDNGKKFTLKALWNNIDASQDKPVYFMKLVENLLAVRIDRYVGFDTEDLKKYINSWGIEMKTVDSFRSDNNFFSNGQSIRGEELSDYLFTQKSNEMDDIAVKRYSGFFNYFIQNDRSIPFLYSLFWSSDSLSRSFYSNMTKGEVIDFLSAVANSKVPFKKGYTASAFGSVGSTGAEDGIIPNYLALDEDIQRVFGDLNIMQEQAKIEIFNATDKPGLASKAKRVFQNLGTNVIKFGNYFEVSENNKLYIPKPNDAVNFINTRTAIKRYFRDDIEVILGDYKYNYSGDLILVIGSK